MDTIRWAVFVSGEGSNLQNFLDLEKSLKVSQVIAVLADRECKGIERAKKSDKKTIIIPPGPESSLKMLQFLEENQIDAIFLMGYMRILKKDFLSAWKKPLINLHPSILPKHKGANAIQKAFDAGDLEFGISLHEVVEEVDSGKILKQMRFPRMQGASLSEIVERVHEFERKIVAEYLFDLERTKSFSKDRG